MLDSHASIVFLCLSAIGQSLPVALPVVRVCWRNPPLSFSVLISSLRRISSSSCCHIFSPSEWDGGSASKFEHFKYGFNIISLNITGKVNTITRASVSATEHKVFPLRLPVPHAYCSKAVWRSQTMLNLPTNLYVNRSCLFLLTDPNGFAIIFRNICSRPIA